MRFPALGHVVEYVDEIFEDRFMLELMRLGGESRFNRGLVGWTGQNRHADSCLYSLRLRRTAERAYKVYVALRVE